MHETKRLFTVAHIDDISAKEWWSVTALRRYGCEEGTAAYDVVLGLFFNAFSELHTAPHAPCGMLYDVFW